MKVSVGQAEDTFLAEADNFTIAGNEKTTKTVVEQSRKTYANPIETPVLDLRQSTEKVSHSNKTPETQNSQIQDQKSDNIVTYPIQRRSKDGIGNKENIKQNIQNNSTTKTKLQTIPITPQQQQILSLIYRFRFLDRTQIQQFMNHKNHKRILLWLNDLNEKKLIKTVEAKTIIHDAKAKIYYLTKNAIPILMAQDIADKSLLQKLYREDDRSPNFVNQCQLIAKIYLDLQNLTTKNYRYLVYVKNDYSNHEFATLLSELSPHAYIEQTKAGKTKCCFLEILPDIPLERLRLRIKKYLSFYQNSEWEVETNQPFPNVLIVCPSENLSLTLAAYVKRKIYQMDEPDLVINFTTTNKVKEFGITDYIWKR
jgi:ribosomal protein S8